MSRFEKKKNLKLERNWLRALREKFEKESLKKYELSKQSDDTSKIVVSTKWKKIQVISIIVARNNLSRSQREKSQEGKCRISPITEHLTYMIYYTWLILLNISIKLLQPRNSPYDFFSLSRKRIS